MWFLQLQGVSNNKLSIDIFMNAGYINSYQAFHYILNVDFYSQAEEIMIDGDKWTFSEDD